jgi:hypothetical protein
MNILASIFSLKPDYITPHLSITALFNSLLDDFYEYNDSNKFCSGLVSLLNDNDTLSEGLLANNERQADLCETITKYYSIKIETIKTAQQMIDNSKKIIDALERGEICNDFLKDDKYACPRSNMTVVLAESVKRSIINVFLEYIDKITRLNDKNNLNRLENIDFTKVVIYKDTLLRLTDELLSMMKNYYTQITQNPAIMKLLLVPESNGIKHKLNSITNASKLSATIQKGMQESIVHNG